MSGATAGQRMGKSKEEGQALMDKFFEKFVELKQAIEQSKVDLKARSKIDDGEAPYVEDWAGRRRHLPDYILAPYEVHLENESPVFNPFLDCEDKQNPADAVLIDKWNKAVADKVAASQEWQKKKNPDFKGKIAILKKAHNPDRCQ